jgi:hypothetical protein
MSIEALDTIVRREIKERRRGRFYFAGLSVAVFIIVAAMLTAI